jgi:hypothetical protein
MSLLTDKGYIAKDGQVCPFCFGVDLEWGRLEATASGARQGVSCTNKDCEKVWVDIYELMGFSEI